jgi:hypothetical protein
MLPRCFTRSAPRLHYERACGLRGGSGQFLQQGERIVVTDAGHRLYTESQEQLPIGAEKSGSVVTVNGSLSFPLRANDAWVRRSSTIEHFDRNSSLPSPVVITQPAQIRNRDFRQPADGRSLFEYK